MDGDLDPQNYIEKWPSGLLLEVLGNDFAYFGVQAQALGSSKQGFQKRRQALNCMGNLSTLHSISLIPEVSLARAYLAPHA